MNEAGNNRIKEKVIDALKAVVDPETGIDVIKMGLIIDLEINANREVSLKFRPSVPTCPLGFKLAFDIRNAINELEVVKRINIEAIDFIYADKLNEILRDVEQTMEKDKEAQQ